MQSGVFRQIDFAHAARAQRGDYFVETKSRAFGDRHRALLSGNSEWIYETGYILSSFELGDYASKELQAGCGGLIGEICRLLVPRRDSNPEPTDYETCWKASMKLDHARCNSIYRIRSRQSPLHHVRIGDYPDIWCQRNSNPNQLVISLQNGCY